MKKIIKKTALFTVIAMLMISFAPQIAAKTIYVVDGYSYTIITDETISLCGYENTADGLNVPFAIADRYVAAISDKAFYGDTSLSAVNFDEAIRLKTIGRYSFADCTSLSGEVVIPKSVTTMQICAFEGCSSLESVVIDAEISTVYNQCFNQCTALKSVTLNDNITTIREYAFANCPNLTYLAIPESVNQIYKSSFANDTNLVLGVYEGSYAMQYAEENQIDHIVLDGDKLGDVNRDGVVDVFDATEIQKYAAERIDFDDGQFFLGDINSDGYCNVVDALLVQKSVIGAYEIPPIVVRY